MVVVASVGGGGADRGGAGAVAEVDGVAQFSGREPAHFGDVDEVAVVVGEDSVEQGAGLLGEVADEVGGMRVERSVSCPGVLLYPNSDCAEMMTPMVAGIGRFLWSCGQGVITGRPVR